MKKLYKKNVYILHLNYRTVYCPKKALNCEMGNTRMVNGNSFRALCDGVHVCELYWDDVMVCSGRDQFETLGSVRR